MAATVRRLSRLRAVDRRFGYRKGVERMAVAGVTFCALLTVAVLAIILGYVIAKGAHSVTWSFLTSLPKPAGETGGGIGNALAGSLIIVALATVIAVPIGVGAAIFLNEFPSRWLGRSVRFLADVLTAVPSIVVGLFAFTLVVQPLHHFSGFSGSIAYAFIMIPIILISAQEALRLVPQNLREASLALGIPRWRTVVSVVLPVASRALLTGLVLAVARALGETAPLLFTAFGNNFLTWDVTQPIGAMPLVIFRFATGPYADLHRQAWAAAFVLIVVVLLASVFTRFVLGRSRER